MATEFKLPELGESVQSAEVARVHVQKGDTIEADQDVVELETEKAVANLPCPHAGKVTEVHVSAGDTVEVGQPVLTIEQSNGKAAEEEKEEPRAAAEDSAEAAEEEAEGTAKDQQTTPAKGAKQERAQEEAEEEAEEERAQEEEQAPSAEQKEAAAREDKEEQKEQPAKQRAEPEKKKETPPRREAASRAGREIPVPAGPATRRLARKLNVELEQVEGTGEPGGRVMPEDVVRAHLVQSPGASAPELPDFDKFGPTERSERNKIAQVATEHLARSWRLIPHVTQHGRADLTDLEKARRDYNENAGDGAAKVTPTALVAAAVVAALKEFPQFNSSLDAQRNELILKRYYHIGFAVDTEQGLLVPVIRDVDQKSIQDVAGELAELAEKARARQLKKEQMEGGTFTISNQGGIGGASFTPIVNWPEVAILGLSRAEMTVKLRDGSPVERLILPLSLSYDHRVINGADAARFIVRLSELLSDFETLLIET